MTDRLGIGGNGPPAFDTFSIALDDLRVEAGNFLDGAALENQGQADAVGKLISTAKKIKKDADEKRAEEKRPHDDAAKAVQTKWKPLLEQCDNIITAAQKPLTVYLNRLADEQRAAEQQAREEAARKAQEAIEASRQAEGDIEATERARALEKAAETAFKDAKHVGKQKAHVAGVDRAVGLRTYSTAVVTDRRRLLQHVMQHDPEALGAWLADYAQKALPSQLPGVRIETERRVA